MHVHVVAGMTFFFFFDAFTVLSNHRKTHVGRTVASTCRLLCPTALDRSQLTPQSDRRGFHDGGGFSTSKDQGDLYRINVYFRGCRD